ncbi:MAG TPA: cytochrome c biogenesis protein ResB [Symbiobacteriaceae bacterium]|nr:cytochrome c biogenesis protein ResB [Symbiobacteriaceae bacterium]
MDEEKVVAPAAEVEAEAESVAAAAADQDETAPEPEKPSKDFLDKTWDFFASVPVAVVLLFLIAAASIGGTLIPQEGLYSDWRTPSEFYPYRYGEFWGNFLYKTGMTRMYTSWWFLSMLFMVGASLVVCSLERFVPLWRAVQRPNPAPPASFVKHLKNRFDYRSKESDPIASLEQALKAARYTVVRQGDRLYADKGRWGRWGPYVLHIGLIFVLAGGMMRAIPGAYVDTFIWVRDGAVVKVPETNWFVRNDKFTMETYENGQPKAYKTQATVIDDSKEVKQQLISMNEPLGYRWTELYQSSYKQELGLAVVTLVERSTGKAIGSFDLDLIQPESVYTVGDHKVKISEYFPEFGIENGKPVSRSSEVRNPGAVLEIITPDGKAYKNWYFVMYPEMEFDPTTPVKLTTTDMKITSTTGLKVKKDYGIPVIYFGLLILSLGACFTFYLAHKRYWALVDGDRVVVGGWTNRNHNSFQAEMAALATRLDPKTNPKLDVMEGEER